MYTAKPFLLCLLFVRVVYFYVIICATLLTNEDKKKKQWKSMQAWESKRKSEREIYPIHMYIYLEVSVCVSVSGGGGCLEFSKNF